MKLAKLPIGIQTFSEIRDKKENYLYIDKTDIAYELLNCSKYIFLSRPRRFGKSLFMDTVQEIFQGNKELFEGLTIYDKWDWDVKYPVIKIVFGKILNPRQLETTIIDTLEVNGERLGLECKNIEDYAICFKELIRKAYEKYDQKVVVLIDEYDKPILDNIDNIEVAKEMRDILSRLYTEIKNADEYIKFTMLTGVSKFSKASIFSGLNMLDDISLDPQYGNICGYTQENIENEFLPYLEGVDLKQLKLWYNGYNFLKDDVYNPFDILLFIKNHKTYKNYWFKTGTPSFLIKLIEKNNYFLPKLANLTVGEKLLDSFDIENLDFEVVLYQAGYLTIDKVITTRRGQTQYKLKLPNEEVRASLFDVILDFMTSQPTEKLQFQNDIYDALMDAELDDLELYLTSMFESIPNNNFTNNNLPHFEGYYASVIFAYFQSLGCDIVAEDITNKGRMDLSIKLNNIIYILEFKMGDGDAMGQIKEKNYAKKYLSLKRDIYLVGINFDENERNISRFEWEKI
ncbi:MAG: ATP-binding protein [Sulfurimonas sp.]|nr:ATP-binding protein [Sulfurimonas sp.]